MNSHKNDTKVAYIDLVYPVIWHCVIHGLYPLDGFDLCGECA